ncbi:MAG: NAD-dependent epimerase/dehydratase family protein [Paracoccaceae bacterium]
MTETVLLTGISGFIAKHVAAKLLTAGHKVRGSLRRMDRADEVRAALQPVVGTEALERLSFLALDLEDDAGWPEAMAGISALIHTASPFPVAQPKDPQVLIRPAVEGTLRALRAARAAGVARVVLTSSTVAVTDTSRTGMQDETCWCDPKAPDTSAYGQSKTLAEQAAWAFASDNGLQLATINPGFVMGPPLDRHYGSSIGVIARILRGKDPMVPMLDFPVVDVRDVAEIHLRALERPEVAGMRILAVAGNMTMPAMAAELKRAYPSRRIATRVAPMPVLRLLALFDPQIKAILPAVGRSHPISNARAREVLAMRFISPEGALRASADWLLQNGGL